MMTRVVLLLLMFIQLVQIRANNPLIEEVANADRCNPALLQMYLVELGNVSVQIPEFYRNKMADNESAAFSDLTNEEKTLENLFLKMLLDRANRFNPPIKRSCQIEATGECRSEEAADVADKYHFLLSSKSPGRKRNIFS